MCKLENNYTTDVLPLEWRFSAPQQGSHPGGFGNRTRNPQRIWLWRSAGFDYRTYTGWGKAETPSWRACEVLCIAGPRGKHPWPQSLSASVGRSPAEARCGWGSLPGTRALTTAVWGGSPLRGQQQPTVQPVSSRAGSPHAKPWSGREHSSTHLQTNGFKFY